MDNYQKEIALSVLERAKRDFLIFRYQREILNFIETELYKTYCKIAEVDEKETASFITQNKYILTNKGVRLWVDQKDLKTQWVDQ